MTAAIAWAPPVELDHPRLRPVAAAPPSYRRPSAAVLRRRRLVAVALAVGLAATAGRVASGWLGAAGQAGPAPAPAPVVLVAEPGDSYWALAARVGPGGDLRSTVDALVRANGGRELRVGDRIALGS